MGEKTKGFFGEFREFIMKGNVLDMAVGVVIATAFGKITSSLVGDIIMPSIGWIVGDIDLAMLNITLSEAVTDASGAVIKDAVVIGIGTFITAVIDFIIIALALFIIIKSFNKAREKAAALRKKEEEAKAEESSEPEEPSEEVKLLTEIRDLLNK